MEFDDIVHAVQAAPAPLSLWELLLDLAKENGIERLSYQHYGVVPRWGENAEPRHEIITVSPTETLHIAAYGISKELVDQYVREKLYLIDPIPELAQKIADPFFWSDVESIGKVAGMKAKMPDALAKARAGDGLAIQVFGPGQRDGFFGLGFGENPPDLSPQEIRQTQCVLQLVHIRYCGFVIGELGNRPSLSPREREVLEWIAKGKSNSVIADILGLSYHTIDTMVRRIFQKLGVNDRVTAAIKGVGAGLVMPDSDGVT